MWLLPRVGSHVHDKVPLPVGAVRAHPAGVVVLDLRRVEVGKNFGEDLSALLATKFGGGFILGLAWFLGTLSQCGSAV